MITLHRLGHTERPFQLNPDLIVSVESTPDTVITLATSAKVVVSDTPEQVSDAVRGWRVQVLAAALRDRSQEMEQAPVNERGIASVRAHGSEPVRARAPREARQPIRALGRGPALAAIGGGGH